MAPVLPVTTPLLWVVPLSSVALPLLWVVPVAAGSLPALARVFLGIVCPSSL
jgi:hypothetical protein